MVLGDLVWLVSVVGCPIVVLGLGFVFSFAFAFALGFAAFVAFGFLLRWL